MNCTVYAHIEPVRKALWRGLSLVLLLSVVILLSACKENNPFDVVTAISGDQSVSLRWSAPYLDIDHFNVYYSTAPGTAAEGQKLAEVSEISPGWRTGKFVHEGLTNGVTYYYAITVVTTEGEELAPSKEVRATPYVPPLDAVNSRYLPFGDQKESIRDLGTGLEWQRCLVGEVWNAMDEVCEGEPGLFVWEAAVLQSAPGGYRLPNRAELQTLIECPEDIEISFGRTLCSGSYISRAFDADAFPTSVAGWVWSNETLRGFAIPRSYRVNFESGAHDGVSYNVIAHPVRLVRGEL